MKKIYLILFAAFSTFLSFGQTAATYTFAFLTGTFTQVTDATSTQLAVVQADIAISAFQPIGFTFAYEGTSYTQFKMSSDGFISFGSNTSTITTNNLSTANATSRPIIAPLWDDMDGNATGGSRASYELTGSAPNRVLTVEWRNWEWQYNSTAPVISFQVKLFETTNVIEFHYRPQSGNVASGSATIGIGSATGSGAGSYLNLTSIATPAVSSTTATNSLSTKPTSGQIYRFSPPPPPSVDLALLSIGLPTSNCANASTPVTVTIKNSGSNSLDFSTTNATVSVAVTGTSPQTLTATLNSGTLAPGASQIVSVSPDANFSAPGSNTLTATVTIAGDGNAANNTASATKAIAAVTTTPWAEPFTTTTTPAGWTITGWTIGSTRGVTGNPPNNIYKNIYSSVPTGQFNTITVGPIASGETFYYDYKVSNFSDPFAAPAAGWGNFQVQISTDCGGTYTTIETVTTSTATYITKANSLSAFVGQTVTIRMLATWAAGDYDIGFDNFRIEQPATCLPPTGLTFNNVTTTTANITFTASGSAPADGYDYFVSTSSTPPPNSQIPTGNGAASPLNITGLNPATTYYIFVRARCSGTDQSSWAGPVTFTTGCAPVTTWSENWDGVTAPALPICFTKVGSAGGVSTQATNPASTPNTLYIYGSATTDQGTLALKPVSNAGAGTNQLRFKLRGNFTAGDVLQVGYLTDPAVATSFVLLQEFTAATLTYVEYICQPGTAPGSNQYLALRAKGTSGASMLVDDLSWEAIPACTTPTGLSVSNISGSAASVNFSGAGTFIIEYGPTGFTPGLGGTAGGGTVVLDATSPQQITGLTPTTAYQVYVRRDCTGTGDGYSVNAGPIAFTTTVACPAPTGVSVGSLTSVSASVTYTVIAGATYVIEYGPTATFAAGTGTTPGNANNMVITSTTSPQPISGLSASTGYSLVIRQDCTGAGNGFSSNSTVVTFTTLGPPPVNDEASAATSLTVNAPCTGNMYTNVNATASANEPFPSCSGIKLSPVWFSFTAPSSGAVRISTALGTPAGTFTDSKIALFSGTNTTTYADFQIIACDEDGGATGSVLPNNSTLFATGLTSGITYYIAVDRYSSSTAAGTYCIQVDELSSSMLSTTNTCSSVYQTPFSSGTPLYNGWFNLLDEAGNLIALARRQAGVDPDLFSPSQNVAGVRQFPSGAYYLGRNFRIASSATNVDLQLFFLSSELASLAAQDPNALISSLKVAKQSEASTGCKNDFAAANGVVTEINASGTTLPGGLSYVSFNTPNFSNFYIHSQATVVPISLEYFTGRKQTSSNLLDWKVTCTNGVTITLERSADKVKFDDISTQAATATRCLQPFSYVDGAPLSGNNYYRLKVVSNVDGTVKYSNIVLLINKNSGFEFVSLVPNPVKATATLSISTATAGRIELNVSDANGQVIMKQVVNAIAGNNPVQLDLGRLAAGTYQVTAVTPDGERKATRFVKY